MSAVTNAPPESTEGARRRTTEGTRRRTTEGTRRRTRAAAVAGAVIAAVAVWGVAVLFGVELAVTPGGGPPEAVGLPAVVLSALAASLAGWGLLAVLERFTRRARPIWTVAAGVVLVASMFGPLDGLTTAAVITLGAMHVAVAAALIPVLARSSASAPAN